MPELPEVETIKRGLRGFILNKKIVQVKVFCEKSFVGPTETGKDGVWGCRLLEGRTVKGLRRFGKALVIDLSGGMSMMIHLRMTGQLIYRDDGLDSGVDVGDMKIRDAKSFAGGHPTDSFFTELPNKQTRVQLDFAEVRSKGEKGKVGAKQGSGRLFFNDQRKFGFIKVLPTDEVLQDKFIASLAPEPWKMTADELYQRLQKHPNSLVKAVMLDQHVICGLGNIYADEALFFAGVRPTRKAGEVSREEAGKLLRGACEVMEWSIESGGSTMATYVKADGTKGDYLRLFAQVFRREGEPCNRCGAEIVKIRVAGRGTHICPRCQK